MKEKITTIIKICIIIIIMIGALFFKFIPEYKATQGSSDTYIDTKLYEDIIEFKVNNQTNFAIVTGKNRLLNILFFDKTSTCLYNQDIENQKIEEGITQILKLLIENDYIKENSTLTLIKYKGQDYEKVKNVLTNQFTTLAIQVNIIEQTMTIEDKTKELNITESNQPIRQLELYSKKIIRRVKNGNSSITITPEEPTEELSREYTDTIYKKIEIYARNNNITNQEIINPSLLITSIPANKEATIYANENSWYYIEDSKVYAYISITIANENYSYCYQASIDEYKKGQC